MKTKIACLVGLALGVLLASGGTQPDWLLRLEVLLFSLAALFYGFTAFAPVAPAWMWSRPVRGVVCVYLGVGAMFVPPQFIVSAVFIGIGTRLILTTPDFSVRLSTPASETELVRRDTGGLVIEERARDGHSL